MSEDLQQQIIELCLQINERCDIEVEDFCFEHLQAPDWYLSILGVLYPHLQPKLEAIGRLPSSTHAMNKLVQEINALDQLEKVDIDASKITGGDPQQVAQLVQVIQALLQIVLQEMEEGEGEQGEQQQQQQQQFNQASPQGKQSPQGKKRPHSDYSKPKSAQAIGNQFQKSEEDDDSVAIRNLKIHEPSEDQQFNPIQKQKLQVVKLQSQKKENFNEPYKSFPKTQHPNLNQQLMQETKKVKKNKPKNQLRQPKANARPESSKKNKKLVAHPKSPTTLKKVKSNEAIMMTRKTQQDIENTKKKLKRVNSPVPRTSPMAEQIARKNKQHEYVVKQHIKQNKQVKAIKLRKHNFDQKNAERLSKVLNWRQERLRKQRQQYEQSLKTKVALQKEQYIKNINNLIIKLEREKQQQQSKDYKEQFMKQYQEAEKRLTALEQWYDNKINMLQQDRKQKRQQRLMIRTGHKQIIRQIEKYLKKQNEDKLIKLTEKCRNEQNNIENDFQELKSKIIKVYKKY